jgi:tRNA 2-thiouridine synthesizing protein A
MAMEEVDVVGEVCPRPALIVRRRLAELDSEDRLRVTGDYPPARENLRRTCEKHGFEVSEVETEGQDTFELEIRVTADASI